MARDAHLLAVFRAALPEGAQLPDDAKLKTWLRSLLSDAHAAHPGIAIEDSAFVERVAHVWSPSNDGELPVLHAGALYVTLAAAMGNPEALVYIDGKECADARAAIHRMGLGHARSEDALQQFAKKLFVPEEHAAPKILEYGGRGELRAWLRVGAVREALKLVRSDKRNVALDDTRVLDAAPTTDPELEQMKALYQPAFKRCFQLAIASLPARDKNLLRQQAIDGLSIDDLATLYHVHRATCARWLEAARTQLFDETRRLLMSEVGVAETECDSIIRLVQSQLHITLRRVLA